MSQLKEAKEWLLDRWSLSSGERDKLNVVFLIHLLIVPKMLYERMISMYRIEMECELCPGSRIGNWGNEACC